MLEVILVVMENYCRVKRVKRVKWLRLVPIQYCACVPVDILLLTTPFLVANGWVGRWAQCSGRRWKCLANPSVMDVILSLSLGNFVYTSDVSHLSLFHYSERWWLFSAFWYKPKQMLGMIRLLPNDRLMANNGYNSTWEWQILPSVKIYSLVQHNMYTKEKEKRWQVWDEREREK